MYILVVESPDGDVGRLLQATGEAEVLSISDLRSVGLVGTARPSAVVLDADFLGETLVAAAETIREQGISGGIVVVASDAEFDVMRRAMVAGVREFLTRPLDPAELFQAIQRIASESPAPAVTPVRPQSTSITPSTTGIVIAVFSPRGGAGSTTIAVNLAAALTVAAIQQGTRVVVVDGRPEFGDIAVALSLDASKSLMQWPTGPEADLEGLLVDHWSGLHVLLPPNRGPLGDEQLAAVVTTLRTRFGFVVVDLGHDLDVGTEAVLELAQHIILVTTTDIAALVQTTRVLDRLALLKAIGRTRLVVNRADERPSIQVAEVERRLGMRATAALPVDKALRDALDVGVPLVLRDPNGKTVQRILEIAKSIAGAVVADAVLSAKNGGRAAGLRPSEGVSIARRGRLLYGVVAVLALGLLLAAALLLLNLGVFNGAPSNAGAQPASSAAARPGIGTVVRDRFWEYTVVSVADVEPDARYFTRQPVGRFLAVDLRLQNLGNQSAVLSQGGVLLRDDHGGEYGVSSEGSLGYYLRSRLTNPFATSIAPGLAVNTAFVFDVPETSRNFVLQIQGAPLAEPVLIALSQ